MPHTAPPPTRHEIERKLSRRSAADIALPVPVPHPQHPQHAPSTSPLPGPVFGSPSLGGETYTTTGTGTGTATASAAGMSEDDLEDIGEEEEDEFSEGEMMGMQDQAYYSDDGEAQHPLSQIQTQVPAQSQQVASPNDVPPLDEDLRRRMEGERLVKSGYLMKKGERRKTWKKRWFVLRTEKLAYYKDDKEYVLCRILNLRDIHSVLAVQLKKNQHHTIGIVTSSRTYYVRAGTAAEMEGWIRALNETRRALAERDELVERQEERRREAGESTSAPGMGTSLPVPERTVGAQPDHAYATTAPLSESMSAMSLSTSPRTSQAHSNAHLSPYAPIAEEHGTPRNLSVGSSSVVDAGQRSVAQPMGMGATVRKQPSTGSLVSSPRGIVPTSGTIVAGNEFQEYGMTPVVHGTGVAAGIITSSESEDDGYAYAQGQRGNVYGNERVGSAVAARMFDFAGDQPQHAPQQQTRGPVSNASSPTITSPVSGFPNAGISALASSLPIANGFNSASSPPVPSPIQTDPRKVILSGYLTKLGNKRKTWRKRWFVLTSGELVYTKSHMDTRVHRSIPLSCMLDALEYDAPRATSSADESSSDDGNISGDGIGTSMATSPGTRGSNKTRSNSHSSRSHRRFVGSHTSSSAAGGASGNSPLHFAAQAQHTFQVITPKRTFKLCAPTEEEEIKWLAALRALINRERGITSPGGAVVGNTTIPFAMSASNNNISGRKPSLPPAVGITRPSPPTNTIEIPPAPVVIGSPVSTMNSTHARDTTSATSPVSHRGGSFSHNPVSPAPSYTGHESYFPPQGPRHTTATSSSSGTLNAARQGGTPSLPPLVTHHTHRSRSATQSAKAAVAEVVRRFHPETSHHSHSQAQT